MRSNHLLKALPAFLAGIAGKMGVKLVIGGRGAYTDGKTVTLPAMPIPTGDTLSPEQVTYLKDVADMALGLLLHEACHINHTDFSVAEAPVLGAEWSPLLHSLWNALEDIRIEHVAAKRWAGLPRMISKMIEVYDRLYRSKNWNARNASSAVLLGLYLNTRLRKELLKNTGMETVFDELRREAEARFGDTFCRMVEGISDEVAEAQSTRDVAEIAVRILTAIEDFEEEQRQQEPQDGRESSDAGAGNATAGDQSSSDGAPAQPEGEDGGEEGDDASAMPSGGASGDASSALGESSDAGAGNATAGDQSSSDGAPAQPEDEDGGEEGDDASAMPSGGASGDASSALGGSSGAPTKEQLDQISALKSASEDEVMKHMDHLIREALDGLADEGEARQHGCTTSGGYQTLGVEGRPPIGTSSRLAKAGDVPRTIAARVARFLNTQSRTRKLIDVRGRKVAGRHLANAVTSGRVFKRVRRDELPDTLVEILLDRSGSMDSQIDLALDAAACIGVALESIPGVSVGITAFPDIVEVVRPGEGMRQGARRMWLSADGGTPTGDAMWWVAGRAIQSSKARKILLVITDGVPNSVDSVRAAVRGIQANGIEIAAIGIGGNVPVKALFDRAANVGSVEELPAAMADILKPLMANKAIAA